MNKNQCELWRKKLSYLVEYHGGLIAIARAARLTPKSVDRIVKGAPETTRQQASQLEPSTTRLIENALDLPDGWFDASVFLPSRL